MTQPPNFYKESGNCCLIWVKVEISILILQNKAILLMMILTKFKQTIVGSEQQNFKHKM